MEIPKYEYYIYTWGGFYNDANVEIHGIKEGGSRWFDTKEERQAYIHTLEKAVAYTVSGLEGRYNDVILARNLAEGYTTRQLPMIHRIVEYKGKRIYSQNGWNWPSAYSTLAYHKEYKWYPGFNDYAVEEAFPGEEIDYTKISIVQEWITGALIIEEDE